MTILVPEHCLQQLEGTDRVVSFGYPDGMAMPPAAETTRDIAQPYAICVRAPQSAIGIRVIPRRDAVALAHAVL